MLVYFTVVQLVNCNVSNPVPSMTGPSSLPYLEAGERQQSGKGAGYARPGAL